MIKPHSTECEQASTRGTNSGKSDQGFSINILLPDRRPRRRAPKTPLFHPGDLKWRFELALSANMDVGPVMEKDLWVRRLDRYLAARNDPSVTEDTSIRISPTVSRAISVAYMLYMTSRPLTHRIEALILTGESDITIAEVLQMSRHTIRAYRKLFFDTDAVSRDYLNQCYGNRLRPLDQHERWKCMALEGGLKLLLVLWKHEAYCWLDSLSSQQNPP